MIKNLYVKLFFGLLSVGNLFCSERQVLNQETKSEPTVSSKKNIPIKFLDSQRMFLSYMCEEKRKK